MATSAPQALDLPLTEALTNSLTRITLDPEVMGGKACIRGLRVTTATPVAGRRLLPVDMDLSPD